ncbi:hypothetical protein, partial [Nonomuraea sp. NPDC049784]|uniref:hypothetical protein n=1 Tax=Nonomuraea sp. NPDC049784 TaxID=3154361 RepID=UPI0033F7E041
HCCPRRPAPLAQAGYPAAAPGLRHQPSSLKEMFMLARDVEAAADEAAHQVVEELEQTARGWFHVEYSLHKREFIAYYLGHCPPPGIMCRAPVADQLLVLMDRVAPPGWRMPDLPLLSARSVSLTQAPPGRGR